MRDITWRSMFRRPARSRWPTASRSLAFERLEPRQLLAIATVSPVADTYTRAGVNAGTAQVLDVLDQNGSGDYMAYVRFDLSGIDIDQITDATLFLYKVPGTRNDIDISDRFDVYGLPTMAGNTPQNWDEATLAEGNVGAEYTDTGGDGLNTARLVNLNQETGANVAEHAGRSTYTAKKLSGPDLVSFLNDRVDDNGLVTFIAYVDAGNVRGWGYASREHSDATLRPFLQIQHTTVTPQPDPYPEQPTVLPRQVEALNRGVIALRRSSSEIYVGWRMLGTDPVDVAFNVYRSTDGGPAVKLNAAPLTQTTDFVDTTANLTLPHEYFVRPIMAGIELAPGESVAIAGFPPIQQYLEIPLVIPPPVTPPGGVQQVYSANDASVGDLDGDGRYEIIVKWVSGPEEEVEGEEVSPWTGNMYLDAYTLDGIQMWRIDLGRNIRTSAQAMQFMVYDLDGDGRAEVAANTAPGAKDGLGQDVIEPGDDPNADYREPSSYVISGPEYLTIFDGETGVMLENIPLEPDRGAITDWGDAYGHRGSTFNTAIAYLDGQRPSLVVGRGIYHAIGEDKGISTAKTELAAYDWRDGQLTERWLFTATEGFGVGANVNPTFVGQGDHNISIGDVDGDGFDEIIYGSMAVDHDGTGLYSTGLGHGDALHVADMDPDNPGLEVFQPHENPGEYADAGGSYRDAQTGEKLISLPADNDVGRGVAFDIDPNHPGYEFWATTHDPFGGTRQIYNVQDGPLYATPGNMFYNFGVWWDADPLRELLDGTTISKWQYDDVDPGTPGVQPGGRTNLVSAFNSGINQTVGLASNNGTKSTPALSGDILGDWREEVVWRKSDSSALQIWSTTIAATSRLVTLMHDTQYRESIAWQNNYYNQPPHPSFFLGAGMADPPVPNVYAVSAHPTIPGDFDLDGDVDGTDLDIWEQTYGMTQAHGYLPGDGNGDGVADGWDFLIWQRNVGKSSTPLVTAQTATVQQQADTAARDAALAGLATDGSPATVRVADEPGFVASDSYPLDLEERLVAFDRLHRQSRVVNRLFSDTATHVAIKTGEEPSILDTTIRWESLDVSFARLVDPSI